MTGTVALSPTAARFAAALDANSGGQVRLEALWAMLQSAAPELLSSSAKRERLAGLLDELAAAGHCRLPRSPSSWERQGRPPLPTFVRVPRSPVPPRLDVLAHPWLPDVAAWVPTARLSRVQLDDLAVINGWLARGGPNGTVLPLRERSYDIFKDEKRLDLLVGGALFRPGRLTLEHLGAAVVHPPFVAERVSLATGLLVVENHNTYWSVLAAAHAHVAAGANCRFGWIAYGAGRQLEGSIGSAHALHPAPTEIRYFGDLDADGIDIPLNTSQVAAGTGLPSVVAHPPLYDLLVELGHRRPAISKTAVPAAAATWLGHELAERVPTVLAGAERIAQEAVNRLVLGSTAHWLELTS